MNTPSRRPGREGKQLVAGHLERSIAKQLRRLAVEDDTTVQLLLEEAIDLLFERRGWPRVAELRQRDEDQD